MERRLLYLPLAMMSAWAVSTAARAEWPMPPEPPARPVYREARVAHGWQPQQVASAPEPFTIEPDGLTLDELESIALANNPTLVQATMQIRAARGKRTQASLYPNPRIGYQSEELGIEDTAGQQGGFVAQEIITAGKLRLGQAVAGHEVRQAQWGYQVQEQRVLSDVRRIRYEVLAARRAVQLNEQLVQVGRQGVEATEALLAAMEVSRVDLLQARIESDSAALRLSDAGHRREATWRRLAAILGIPDMQPEALNGSLEEDIPSLDWEESLDRLLAESPELARAWAGVRRARCALAEQCAGRIPNIDVRAEVLRHNTADTTVAGVEIGFPLPLFNRNQGNIARAQAELIAAENELQRIELALQDRLAVAFRRYANARDQVQRYKARILPDAKASLELIQGGYRQGEFDYLKLLTAQRTYFRVNLACLESLLQYHLGRVTIEGLLLSGGLDQVASSR